MGKIKAVSISKRKGTKKTNVAEVVLKQNYGILEDAHAGPGKRQVSLLAEESIEKIKIRGLNVAPGDFAENITTEGIDLTRLKIGTKLKIGRNVLLEISQIGKECHSRCNIYYQAGDCVMPREGIFARVLAGGTIKPGDKVGTGPKGTDKVGTGPKGTGLILRIAKNFNKICAETCPLGTRPHIYKVAVLTVSDKCSKGQRKDESGRIIQELINNLPGKVMKYEIIPDDPEMIKERLIDYCDNLKADLVLTNGGTGFTERDLTPEATKEVIEREVPGIPEAMRTLCLNLTKRAMLSRGIAGIRKTTLIVNLPGSTRGAKESLEAILEGLPHGLDMIAGREH